MLRTYSTTEKTALLSNLATIVIPGLQRLLMEAAAATDKATGDDGSIFDHEDYAHTMIQHLSSLLWYTNLPTDNEDYDGIEFPTIHQLTPEHAREWFGVDAQASEEGSAGSDDQPQADDDGHKEQPVYRQWRCLNEAPTDYMIYHDKAALRYWAGEFMVQIILPRIAAVIDDAARKVSREHLTDSPAAVALLRDYMLTELAGGLTMTGYQRDETIDWSLLDDEEVMRDVMTYPRKSGQQQQGGES